MPKNPYFFVTLDKKKRNIISGMNLRSASTADLGQMLVSLKFLEETILNECERKMFKTKNKEEI